MTSSIESAITVAELAKAIRKTEAKTTSECAELGIIIGESWSGKPAVSTVDAHALASGQARAARTRDREWHSHQRRTEAWEEARLRAYQDAASAAHDAASRQGRGGPAAHGEAEQAGKAAALAYEKKNRMPTFEGTPTTRSWFEEVGAR